MKTSSLFAATLLLFLIPCMVCAKERGTVVHIWEQRDLYARHYIYQVETETHVYEFIANYPRAFQLGDSITFTLDKDHQHVHVVADRDKNQDVQWIEELMGRRASLRADAIIAVSSSGFTVGALTKAKAHGIIPRDLRELTEIEVKDWGQRVALTLYFYQYSDLEVSLFFERESINTSFEQISS